MKDLNEIVRQANDAVKGVEEPLKTIAFERILDKLLENNTIKKKTSKTSQRPKKKRTTAKKSEELDDKVKNLQKLCNSINRSKYPGIYKLSKNLDRALFVLKIVQEDFKEDGLTAPAISQILKDVFRIKATKEAVSMALMDAKLLVDRNQVPIKNGGRTYVYQLMKAGEDHLDALLQTNEE